MSVELISLGNFDYSGFNLTSCEEAIISYLVKHHIDSYNITINITTKELVFYMNMTSLSQDKATDIFTHIFNLLEQQFIEKQVNYFVINILHHSFTFSRTIKLDVTDVLDSQNLVNWTISTSDLSSFKLALFDFYHKKQSFYNFLDKYPEKNTSQKLYKI